MNKLILLLQGAILFFILNKQEVPQNQIKQPSKPLFTISNIDTAYSNKMPKNAIPVSLMVSYINQGDSLETNEYYFNLKGEVIDTYNYTGRIK